MSEKEITQLYSDATEQLQTSSTLAEVQAVEICYLGKKGRLTAILKSLGQLEAQERRVVGKQVNICKNQLMAKLNEKKQQLIKSELQAQIEQEKLDVTLPGRAQSIGTLHPITIVTNRLVSVLAGMGFATTSGPEIEDDYHNFEALNFPANHPARDMQDTFFVEGGLLLRTHTSSAQVRVMEEIQPPIKIIAPGKAFRADEIDATHTPMFHQIEGLYIDKDVSFADLKSVVYAFLEAYFAAKVKIRFRPSFFPFTEPSAEVDLWHNGRWLEVMGCGMVHPRVLEKSNIDSKTYTGYAFGLGIDRLAMLTYGIDDLRDLFSNDIRILAQFKSEQWGGT
jgi:phenylalanyl-tRNA synthetase alpha chain